MLTAFEYFQACQILAGTSCGRRIHMQSLAEQYLHDQPYAYAGVVAGASKLRRELQEILTISTVEQARLTLVMEEFNRAIAFIENDAPMRNVFDSFEPTQATLSQYFDGIRAFYHAKGIEIPDASIYLVDELPKPYTNKGFYALTADEGDRKRHGITPGLYFMPKGVAPVIIEYAIAHEIIHIWLGNRSPDDSCTMFEEGLGEYLSVFGYLASRYGPQRADAFYRYYRLNSAFGSRYDAYVDGLRQIVGIATSCGYAKLIAAANSGRPELNQLLIDYANAADFGGLPGLDKGLISGEPVPYEFAAQGHAHAIATTMVFPRSLIVSAEAFLVARVARNGMSIREAAKACSTSEELARKAIAELDERALMTVRVDGQVISRNLAASYLDLGHLRYDFR
jgi:hypothetical protein